MAGMGIVGSRVCVAHISCYYMDRFLLTRG